jgi:hypothetical protein
MNNFRITDGKGFCITFSNGWSISVQFGRGNYADNYEMSMVDWRESNRLAGEQGSCTAECAVINPAKEMVELPAFMFDGGYRDIVSNRSTVDQVHKLINWTASQL